MSSPMDRVKARFTTLLGLGHDARLGAALALRLSYGLRRRIRVEEAREGVRRRLENRAANLLTVAKRAVYPNQDSPFRRLLELAGCEYGDLVQLVEREGVESALTELYRSGVYLTVDEFKGRVPAVRGSATVATGTDLLRNPLAGTHVLARSSGSRSAGTTTAFDLRFVRDCAANASLVLAARGGEDWLKGYGRENG